MDGTKECPHCGKEIKVSAVKCRYCGWWLEDHRVKPKGTQDPSKLKGERVQKIFFWVAAILITYMLLCLFLHKQGIESFITAPLDAII